MPTRLAAGEEYATVDQILLCSDLPQATLTIPHWRINGKPAKIRVRGLSLSERDQVQKAGDLVAQYCLTWQIACVMPQFTQEQAKALATKNYDAVEKAVRFIWLLSSLDQEWIEDVVTQQTDAPPAEPPPPPDADADADGGADRGDAARLRRVA